jgi:hypothetical protein
MPTTEVFGYTVTPYFSNEFLGPYFVDHLVSPPYAPVADMNYTPGSTFTYDGTSFLFLGAAESTPGVLVGFMGFNDSTREDEFFSQAPFDGLERTVTLTDYRFVLHGWHYYCHSDWTRDC